MSNKLKISRVARNVYFGVSNKVKHKSNEKYNKQCLLDTPRRVTVNNKRLISNLKSQRKNMHIQKPWHY